MFSTDSSSTSPLFENSENNELTSAVDVENDISLEQESDKPKGSKPSYQIFHWKANNKPKATRKSTKQKTTHSPKPKVQNQLLKRFTHGGAGNTSGNGEAMDTSSSGMQLQHGAQQYSNCGNHNGTASLSTFANLPTYQNNSSNNTATNAQSGSSQMMHQPRTILPAPMTSPGNPTLSPAPATPVGAQPHNPNSQSNGVPSSNQAAQQLSKASPTSIPPGMLMQNPQNPQQSPLQFNTLFQQLAAGNGAIDPSAASILFNTNPHAAALLQQQQNPSSQPQQPPQQNPQQQTPQQNPTSQSQQPSQQLVQSITTGGTPIITDTILPFNLATYSGPIVEYKQECLECLTKEREIDNLRQENQKLKSIAMQFQSEAIIYRNKAQELLRQLETFSLILQQQQQQQQQQATQQVVPQVMGGRQTTIKMDK